jgi:hypothetical protein
MGSSNIRKTSCTILHPMSLKASGGTGSAAGATATEPDPPQRIVAHDKGPEDPFAAKKLCRSVECRSPALFAVVHLLHPMNTSFWARQRPEKPGNPYSPIEKKKKNSKK